MPRPARQHDPAHRARQLPKIVSTEIRNEMTHWTSCRRCRATLEYPARRPARLRNIRVSNARPSPAGPSIDGEVSLAVQFRNRAMNASSSEVDNGSREAKRVKAK